MSEFNTIGSFLRQVRREVCLKDDEEYNLLGVKWYGQGVFLRETKKGKEIKAKKLYQVRAGDFIYNRLFAWKSSFSIVENEFDGCLVSNEFPLFEYDQKSIDPHFLLIYVLQPNFIDQVNRTSGGMSGISRKRYKEAQFKNALFPAWSIQKQKTISRTIKNWKSYIEALNIELATQSSLLTKLRQSILQEVIEGKLTADWRKANPVRKGDPEYDAEALLAEIKAEKQKMIAEGKIKKEKALAPIKKEDLPFEVPEGWVWTRLGEIGLFGRGKSKHRPRNDPSLFINGIYPFVQTGDVSKSKYNNYQIEKGKKFYNEKGLHQSQIWVKGTLCITIAANIAETGFLALDACFPDSVVGFSSLSGNYTPQYLRYFLDCAQSNLIKFAPATAQKNINLEIIERLPISFPSLIEQCAIVKRVETLLSMVDELEKQVKERKEDANMLLQEVLREAFEEAPDKESA
ncbi:MAG: restriction endonuclease subunit S [Desulfamplus sp.]|nr:restriction endonuclease subunit S [Desulfamplus sp.]